MENRSIAAVSCTLSGFLCMAAWFDFHIHIHSSGPRQSFFNGWDLLQFFFGVAVLFPGAKILSWLGMEHPSGKWDLFLFCGLFLSGILYALLFYVIGCFIRFFREE